MTFDALGSGDKTLYVFSKANGHVADYGHCDLAWSRYAPREVFPVVIDWLDRRQPGVSASRQQPASLSASAPQSLSSPGTQKSVDADL